jgi:phosphoglycolate phosphatase
MNYELIKQTQSKPNKANFQDIHGQANHQSQGTSHKLTGLIDKRGPCGLLCPLSFLKDISIKYKAILFDLDGTLLDTLEDLADAGNAALRELNFPAHSKEDYKYFIGKGIEQLVRQILPEDKRDKKTVAKCLVLAKKYYSQYWKRSSRPDPGIEELLTELDKRRIVKVVFSNKPDEFTGVMIRELLPRWKFEIIRGALPNVPIKPDPTAALQIATEVKIQPQKFIYIGDSATDMQTANAAGMYAVGALWGFHTAEELSDGGAKVLVKEPIEVLKLF